MPEQILLGVRALVPGIGPVAPRLDVDAEFHRGITAVMGASGAGKSTLLSVIAGLEHPERGRIVLDGEELFSDSPRRIVPTHRRRTALVFQSLALFPHLTAWENVAYGLRGEHTHSRRRRERAQEWLERTRVRHLGDRRPGSLSGGEAQRVAIARALASEPNVLLLDEPFSALDAALRAELGADLRTLVDELGIPALLVTHHVEDATSLGSRILVMEAGRIARDTARRPDTGARQDA